MAEKTSTTSKASEPAARGTQRQAPPPAAAGPTSTIVDLQQAAGNQSVGRLLGRALVQRKEAGGGWLEATAGLAAGADAPPQSDAPAAEPGSPEPGPETPASEPAGEPETEPLAAEEAPAAAIVEDDAAEVGEGQMRKSDFLAALRSAVCDAAEAGLAGTEHSAQGCPFIDFWIGYYRGQSAERFNRDLPRFAGEGPRPTTAEGYIPLIAARVRQSVETWARTGEITGVPQGIPLPGMGLPGLSGGGMAASLLGGVFFKALPGGPRDSGSPAALRSRLGDGRLLDGGVRSRMESALGRSFGHVRVHTDRQAAGLSRDLNARAFAVGEHVAFGSAEYRPGTLVGDALIAHELAHVAQQDGTPAAVQPMRVDSAGYGALERDADLAAAGAVASLWGLQLPGLRLPQRAAPRLSSGLRLQRCGGCNKKATTPSAKSPGKQGTKEPAEPVMPAEEERSFCAAESDHPGIMALMAKAGAPTPSGRLAYGFTFWSKDNVTRPKVAIEWTKAGSAWTGTVKPTTTSMGAVEGLYLKEGDHEVPGKKFQANFPQCGTGGKKVPMFSHLSKDLSLLSRTAEQEHCDDYKRGFELTYEKWAGIINSVAGTAFGPGSKAAVTTQINAELKRRGDKGEAAWVKELNRLKKLGVDERDGKGWHSLKSDAPPVTADAACTKLEAQTDKTSRTNIPGPLSKDLIK